jgi:hypothetical protein
MRCPGGAGPAAEARQNGAVAPNRRRSQERLRQSRRSQSFQRRLSLSAAGVQAAGRGGRRSGCDRQRRAGSDGLRLTFAFATVTPAAAFAARPVWLVLIWKPIDIERSAARRGAAGR